MLGTTDKRRLRELLASLPNDIVVGRPRSSGNLVPAGFSKRFHSLETYEQVDVEQLWKMTRGSTSFGLCLLAIRSREFKGPSKQGDSHRTFADYCFTAVVSCRRDYARTLIRPETLYDKIGEWFAPQEIDFAGHPGFSSRFFVLSTDEAKFRTAATDELLERIAAFPDVHVEFNATWLLARWLKRWSQESLHETVAAGLSLAECAG